MRNLVLSVAGLVLASLQSSVVSVKVTPARGQQSVHVVATSTGGALQYFGDKSKVSRDTIRVVTPADFILDLSKGEAVFSIEGDTGWIQIDVQGRGGQPHIQSSSRRVKVLKKGLTVEVRGVP